MAWAAPIARGETCNDCGSGITDYTQAYGREFRYDGGRQRYMAAPLNEALNVIEAQTDWTDYDGDAASVPSPLPGLKGSKEAP